MLACRELCTAQVKDRLHRKGFSDTQIEPVVRQLRREGALNDHRTAVAYAHSAAHVKMRGRRRAVRELQGFGISREQSEAAVAHVYGELDERVVLERALARRLQGRVETRAEFHRLYHYLLRQGFDGHMVMTALTARTEPTARATDDSSAL